MELRDAFDQIAAIRTQLAATERVRALRAVPVAFSGFAALLAAVAQSLWIAEPAADPQRYLLLWVGAALISALGAGLELLARARRRDCTLDAANALHAVRLFTPCLCAGAAVTSVVAFAHPGLLWLLPGLWQLLFGLGNLAAHRVLPAPAFAVGAMYLASGTACLWLGARALEPWAMGLPFLCGQLALAAILWWHHERPRPQPRTEAGR
jgi:hypothetical protein